MTLRLPASLPWQTLLCLVVVVLVAPSRANTEEQMLARLDTATESTERARQARTPRDAAALLSSLGELDANIKKAGTRIRALESTVSKHSSQLDTLRERINAGRNLSDGENAAIRAQIRATWRVHSLMNRRAERYRQAPADWRRTQHYLDALNDHLERRRGQARLALVDVMSTVHEADAVKRQLAYQSRDLQQELSNLKHLEASRQPILIQLDTATERSGSKLITLYAEDDAVKAELNAVDNALADNALPWPLAGAVHTRFGDKTPSREQHWQGIRIGGSAGETVHAVGDGVVVYAGWLRGQGLLVIVDHGDGMMAVYGNNHHLLAEVGDNVVAGDPIATIGVDKVTETAELYFELRVEGQAVDPLNWLSSQPG